MFLFWRERRCGIKGKATERKTLWGKKPSEWLTLVSPEELVPSASWFDPFIHPVQTKNLLTGSQHHRLLMCVPVWSSHVSLQETRLAVQSSRTLSQTPTRWCSAATREAETHCLQAVWCFDSSVVHHRQAPPLSAQSVPPSPIIHTCSTSAIKLSRSAPSFSLSVGSWVPLPNLRQNNPPRVPQWS